MSRARPIPKATRKKTSAKNDRVPAVLRLLERYYPNAECALNHRNAFELLVATILSAQCTDARVNIVTPSLFAKFPTPKALAAAPLEDIEQIIKPTGFFRAKARSLSEMSKDLVEKHEGKVPKDMAKLVALRGVGRKTAKVELGVAFHHAEGTVDDTHVGRI